MKIYILEASNLHKKKILHEFYLTFSEAAAALKFYYEKIKNNQNLFQHYIKINNEEESINALINSWTFFVCSKNVGIQQSLLDEINSSNKEAFKC